MKRIILWALCMGIMLPAAAWADSYTVSVGYADGLRGGGFFPNPWSGDPGIVFVGNSGSLDAGAVMITNTSGGTITVNDVSVTLNGTGPTFDLWGSNTLLAGQSLVLTSTSNYNFDTSDSPTTSCGSTTGGIAPLVIVKVDGTPTTFTDSGLVLNTGGFDYACKGNESFAWRPIGGAGGPAGVPEPSTLALLGTGGLGLLGNFRKRFFS